MSNYRTHGYDIVLQYSASKLTEIFTTPLYRLPIYTFHPDFLHFFGDFDVEIEWFPNGIVYVDFCTIRENGLNIRVSMGVRVTLPGGILSFTAVFTICHPISLAPRIGVHQCLHIDFTEGVENIQVRRSGSLFWGGESLQGDEMPMNNGTPLFDTNIEWASFLTTLNDELASRFSGYLRDHVRIIDSDELCFNMMPNYGSEDDPMVPNQVDFLVVSFVEGDVYPGALIVLFTTGGGSPGDKTGFTDAGGFIYTENQILLMFGKDLILRRIVCPALLERWGVEPNVEYYFEFDGVGSATLIRNIPVTEWVQDPIEEAEITSLALEFVDDDITITGWVSTAATTWTCECNFSGSVTGLIGPDGVPMISAHIDPGAADFRYRPWFEALHSLGLFFLLPWLSLVIQMTVQELVSVTIESLVESIFRCVFPRFSERLPFPFLRDADINQVILDDLAVFCRPRESEADEASSQPEVWIEGSLEVANQGNPHTTLKELMGGVEIIKTSYEKVHFGAFRARMRYLTIPVTCRWYLDDQLLDGSGSVVANNGRLVHFTVAWHRCEIQTDMGVSLDAELKLVAEDGRDVRYEARLQLFADGKGCMRGVTGEDVIMGPIVDPPRMLDLITEVSAAPQWGERPDEIGVAETVHQNECIAAFRKALCKGMGIDDESELPSIPC